jgi:hypothetical protein
MTKTGMARMAMDTFVATFGGHYQVSSESELVYKIFNGAGKHISYAKVIVKSGLIRTSEVLSISASQLGRLIDKRLNPVIIWVCDDGIIYAKPHRIQGTIGHVIDGEVTASYNRQGSMKYIRWTLS